MKDFPRQYQPRFTPTDGANALPADIWRKCPNCHRLLYTRQLYDQHEVCDSCGYHFRLAPAAWIALLCEHFEEFAHHLAPGDPLAFHDAEGSYPEKLQRIQMRLNQREAVVCGEGRYAGMAFALAISDFRFLGGSMGSVYGEKIARSIEHAIEQHIPLLTINTSGGARMHEGLFSLMQMAKTAVALHQLASAGVPHIALLCDPCYGGVTASYASAADVVLAEPGAHIGFAGPRVIAQTIGQALPESFQSAEFLLEHGLIDAIVPRCELRTTIEQLLKIYASRPAVLACER